MLDLMGHAPRSLIGHSQLSLNLSRCHSFVTDAKKKHDVEPVLQRRSRSRKWCAGLWVDMVGAPLANEGRLKPQSVKFACTKALGTLSRIAKTQL
jgi:hypothetical protein